MYSAPPANPLLNVELVDSNFPPFARALPYIVASVKVSQMRRIEWVRVWSKVVGRYRSKN